MKRNKISISILLVAASLSLSAQNTSKAWEFGLGGSVFQFNRVAFSNFSKLEKGYQFDLDLKHAVYGGNMYVARELNSHFYLDMQATTGFTKESLTGDKKTKWYYMAGLGLQWRLGDYFGSQYIDPYLRAGVNYMHKDFKLFYTGTEGLAPDEMKWVLENMNNKSGVDRTDLMPISLGAGLNMWLNDRLGIGFQADYLLMPYKDVANSLQGTIRIMWRLGGNSKKPAPVIQYVEVERVVEKVVEKPVVVEKVIELPGEIEYQTLYDDFNRINFEFDSAELTPESEEVVAGIAEILKRKKGNTYLITGYTDSRGSVQYNESLSRRRAVAVVEALIDLGVPQSMLKSRGVGSKIAYIKPRASDYVRSGDRKVTIELITNTEYWDLLPDNDL